MSDWTPLTLRAPLPRRRAKRESYSFREVISTAGNSDLGNAEILPMEESV